MLFRRLFFLPFLFLSACGTLEHDTPSARSQIQHDLHLAEIIASSTMSFCFFSMGDPAICRATPGIGILTAKSLILADYSSGVYVQRGVITTDEVRCITAGDGRDFYAFTDKQAVRLFPYIPGTDRNVGFRDTAIKMLLAKGQPYLMGEAGSIAKDNGRKTYGTTSISVGGASVVVPIPESVFEISTPCPSDN
jgi:hypothetical protein